MGIFISRLLPVVRHLIGIPAGIVRMDYLKFSLFTLLGSGIWCSVLCYVGIKAGQDEDLMKGEYQSRHPLARGRDAGARRAVLFLRPPAHDEKRKSESRISDPNKDCAERQPQPGSNCCGWSATQPRSVLRPPAPGSYLMSWKLNGYL